jgi:cbb3-type cytochrome oxidase subunit 3
VVKSRNTALAIALIALAILFYAVTIVRMRESEDRRHLNDPQAHSAPTEPTSRLP